MVSLSTFAYRFIIFLISRFKILPNIPPISAPIHTPIHTKNNRIMIPANGPKSPAGFVFAKNAKNKNGTMTAPIIAPEQPVIMPSQPSILGSSGFIF